MDIILYLLSIIQHLYQQNCWLINFILQIYPSSSSGPMRIPILPNIKSSKSMNCRISKPLSNRTGSFSSSTTFGATENPSSLCRDETAGPSRKISSVLSAVPPHHFIYDNNGGKGQYQCKVCGQTFSSGDLVTAPFRLLCPHCGHSLAPKKERKHFIIHKCVNPKCPCYLRNLKNVDAEDLKEPYGKNKHKLHYIYRQFTIDFFRHGSEYPAQERFFPENSAGTMPMSCPCA